MAPHGISRYSLKIAHILFSAAAVVLLPAVALAEDAVDAPRPNILFAMADDWSFGHAGVYGCNWVKTPAFDRIARDGILFTRAYTPNAKCAPSRACILTGRNSWQLEEACNHVCFFPPKFKTYAEVLAEQGYIVGATGKGWGPGVANDASGKRRLMAGQSFSRRKAAAQPRTISNNDYAGNFEDFLNAAGEGKPWCFWYGTTEPHRGYEYGAGVAKAGKKLTDIDHVPGFWPDNETVRNDMLDYAVEVEHFDTHLLRILELLSQRGELENTLVVATSDHGMPFPRCKGQAYDYSNHIPLAVMWPEGIKQSGRVVDDYVSFIDLAPTFIEVAGLAWNETGMQSSPGRSLTDIFVSGRSGQVNPLRDHVLIGKERHDVGRPHDWGYPIRAIVKGNMLYLQNFETDRWPAGNPETGYLNCDGGPTKTLILQGRTERTQASFWKMCFGKRPREEMYDIGQDPDCLTNLADSPDRQELKQQLQQQLFAQLRAEGDPRMLGNGEIFDKYIYSGEDTRGFYERYMRGEKVRAGWVNTSDFEKEPLDEE